MKAGTLCVLVCGGRDFTDRDLVYATLDALHANPGIDRIVHGDARGADWQAKLWARANDVDEDRYPAHWSLYGPKAGPIRNEKMLAEGRPDLVVAFPGGKGTADMIRRARKAGIEVREIPASPEAA